MEEADLVEHPLVPVGRRADEAGEPADPVGEAAGAGVDEPRREGIPRRVLRECRVGEAGPHPIDQPAVEFVEPLVHPRHPLVASVGPVDRRRRHVVVVSVVALIGDLAPRVGGVAGPRRRGGVGRSLDAAVVDHPAPLQPRRDVGGRNGLGDVPADPQQQQREGVLARHPSARARAPDADVTVVDDRVVRFGAAPAERPPHRVVVGTEMRPAARRGDRSRRGEHRQ